VAVRGIAEANGLSRKSLLVSFLRIPLHKARRWGSGSSSGPKVVEHTALEIRSRLSQAVTAYLAPICFIRLIASDRIAQSCSVSGFAIEFGSKLVAARSAFVSRSYICRPTPHAGQAGWHGTRKEEGPDSTSDQSGIINFSLRSWAAVTKSEAVRIDDGGAKYEMLQRGLCGGPAPQSSFGSRGSQVQILPLRPNKIRDLAVVCRPFVEGRPPIRPPKQKLCRSAAMAKDAVAKRFKVEGGRLTIRSWVKRSAMVFGFAMFVDTRKRRAR
jgi:hypothetical protein